MIINYKKTYIDLIVKEHYPVESISVIVILVSIIIGIRFVFLMYRRKIEKFKIIFVGLLVLGLIFVGLEEVSWGQWFFYFNSPEYFKETNLQRETNIHNLKNLHVIFEYIRVFIGVGGLISIFLNNTRTFKYISSPFVLILFFVVIIIFSGLDVYNYYLTDQRVLSNVGSVWWFLKLNMEIIELMIGFSALIFLYSNYRSLKYN